MAVGRGALLRPYPGELARWSEGDEGKRRRMTSRTCGWRLRGSGWSRASYPRRPGLAGGGQQRLAVVRGCEEGIARFKASRGGEEGY